MNGRWPYSPSYSETQKLNWSLRPSSGRASSCSGDMYAIVPASMFDADTSVGSLVRGGSAPSRVASKPAAVACGAVTSSDVSSAIRGNASPKSSTRARPSWPTSTLSGLKSRWTMSAWCAAASPAPAWMNTSRISASDRGALASQRRSVAPRTNSIAMYTTPPVSPTS